MIGWKTTQAKIHSISIQYLKAAIESLRKITHFVTTHYFMESLWFTSYILLQEQMVQPKKASNVDFILQFK